MTAFSPRRSTRVTLAVGAASLGLLALTACEKPSPNAHFTLGSETASPEAESDCYGHGDLLSAERAERCLNDEADDAPSFSVRSGDTLRVGVDPEVAETGWLLFVNGQLYGGEPFTGTYRSFSAEELYEVAYNTSSVPGELPPTERLRISVAKVGDDYDSDKIYGSADQESFQQELFSSLEGVWHARLEPAEA